MTLCGKTQVYEWFAQLATTANKLRKLEIFLQTVNRQLIIFELSKSGGLPWRLVKRILRKKLEM